MVWNACETYPGLQGRRRLVRPAGADRHGAARPDPTAALADRPRRRAEGARCSASTAARTRSASPRRRCATALKAAGKTRQRDHRLPDAGHGFHADYRASYVEADAKDGWSRLLALLRRQRRARHAPFAAGRSAPAQLAGQRLEVARELAGRRRAAPRCGAPRAAPWCGRARRSGGRCRAASGWSAAWPATSPPAAGRATDAGAPLGDQVGLLQAVVLGGRLLDVVDGDRASRRRAGAGRRKAWASSRRQAADAGAGADDQGVERAFQLAHAVGEAVGQELQHFGPQLRGDALLAAEQRRACAPGCRAAASGRPARCRRPGPPDRCERSRASISVSAAGGRSAENTTRRPSSVSAARVWNSSSWLDCLPPMKCTSSISSRSAERSSSLKAGRLALHQRPHERRQEPLGGQVDHLACPAPCAWPPRRWRSAGGSCRSRRRRGRRPG